ncbi:MAG: DUF1761 domain-containing protein [Cohaesibacteraceae bacterium]
MPSLLYDAFPWWSIPVAAVVAFIIGSVYYGALAKPWAAAQGKLPSDFKPSASLFITSFIAELIMAWMLMGMMGHASAVTVQAGLISGAFLWFGFVITTMVVNHAYGGAKRALTVIDGGHWLLVLLAMGAVLGFFAS